MIGPREPQPYVPPEKRGYVPPIDTGGGNRGWQIIDCDVPFFAALKWALKVAFAWSLVGLLLWGLYFLIFVMLIGAFFGKDIERSNRKMEEAAQKLDQQRQQLDRSYEELKRAGGLQPRR